MTEAYGKYLRLRVEGTSRSPYISCVLTGFPANIPVSVPEMQAFLSRRAPGKAPWSTARTEPDVPEIVSGISGGMTDGSPIEIRIRNTDAKKSDSIDYTVLPRPSHADYTAVQKYGRNIDLRGGGHFSGRLTAPYCAAGFLCSQYLLAANVRIFAHLYSVGNVGDTPVDANRPDISALEAVKTSAFPTVSKDAGEQMIAAILAAKEKKDSLGGVIECMVTGLPAGLGEHMFRSVEAAVSDAVFAIPGVKGIEFGDGFPAARATGSRNNDGYRTDGTRIFPETNHAGGILGGMTTGAPLVFRVACKPTPSVGIPQHTVNLNTFENTETEIVGRNDPCFAPRAVPAVEAAAAIALCDLMLSDIPADGTLNEYRHRIDNADAAIADAFSARIEAAGHIGEIKRTETSAVYQSARERAVLENIRNRSIGSTEKEAADLYRHILHLSKNRQSSLYAPAVTGYADRKIVLIGNPLGHSLSVPIHSRLSDYSYTLHPLPEAELVPFLQSKNFDGLNITIPYKKAVLPYLQSLSEEAAAVGAVNTVVKTEDGNLFGANTDVCGFRAMLRRLPNLPKLQSALILGNGGAAAAVRHVLRELALPYETVTRRDEGTLHFDRFPASVPAGTLLVNCTPCGMFPEEAEALLTDAQVSLFSAVADLVYNPLRTRLLQQAEKAGIPAVGGLEMLVYQAAGAAELFCGKPVPEQAAERILREITAENRNIVLVGMPGCGKTTVGKLLSEQIGRRFFDTDADIAERTGYFPADYIRVFGEEAFRAEEAVSVRTAAHLRGAVIATGGGAVLSGENRYRLRSSGRVYFLDRELTLLPQDGRPVTEKYGVEALYKVRLPFYLETADRTVPVSGPEETAERVLTDFYAQSLNSEQKNERKGGTL